jgi:hypothetical protein
VPEFKLQYCQNKQKKEKEQSPETKP